MRTHQPYLDTLPGVSKRDENSALNNLTIAGGEEKD